MRNTFYPAFLTFLIKSVYNISTSFGCMSSLFKPKLIRITKKELAENIDSILKQVSSGKLPIIINESQNDVAVLLSIEEYEQLKLTASKS